MITETDDIARGLDAASRIWPELRNDRAALLRRLISAGHESIRERSAEERSDKLRAIHETAGMFSGMYPLGEADRLKNEWPA